MVKISDYNWIDGSPKDLKVGQAVEVKRPNGIKLIFTCINTEDNNLFYNHESPVLSSIMGAVIQYLFLDDENKL